MRGKKIYMKPISALLLVILLSLSLGIHLYATDEKAKIEIDTTNLTMGASAKLSLVFETTGDTELVRFDGLDQFDVISSNQVSSTQIINGNSTSEKSINYIIMPKQVGSYSLQAVVKIDGHTYETNTIDVTVSERDTNLDGETEDVFIKTVVSNNETYFGEKVIVSYELYTRYNISQYGFLDSVELDGFIIDEIQEDSLTANYVTIDGNQYAKYEVKKLVLNPVKVGSYEIPSYNFQVNLSTGDFFSPSEPQYLQTEPVSMVVKELPITNQPVNFSGLVGDYTIDAHYDKASVAYGDPVTLKVDIEGQGNLDLFDNFIDSEALADFSVYETDQAPITDTADNQYHVQRAYQFILVPKNIGDFNIGDIAIDYFDTSTESYKQLIIPGTTIHVSGTVPEQNDMTTETSAPQGTVTVSQVNYDDSSNKDQYSIHFSKNVVRNVIIIIICVIILGIGYVIIKKRTYKLKHMKVQIGKVKRSKHIEEAYDILNQVIKDVYHVSLKSQSRSDIRKIVDNEEISETLMNIMDYLEHERYHSEAQDEKIKDNIVKTIITLDRYK